MTKTILFILNKSITEDPRSLRQVTALAELDYQVDVICPAKKDFNVIDMANVTYYIPPVSRKRSGKIRYIMEYMVYFLYCSFLATILHIKKRYALMHISVMPEFLMFCAIIPKLFGVKMLMDWIDPFHEVYLSKFNKTKQSRALLLIDAVEKLAVKFSDRIIVPNIGFTNAFKKRNTCVKKIDVIPNSADDKVFIRGACPQPVPGVFNLVYYGTAVNYNGLKVTVDAFIKARKINPGLRLTILGDGPDLGYALTMQEEHNLFNDLIIKGRIPITELHCHLNTIDLGIVSNLRSPFTMINLPTRIMELITLGKPVICSDLAGIRDYFTDEALKFFPAGNSDQLAQCIVELSNATEKRKSMTEHAKRQYEKICWTNTRKDYIKVIQELV